MGLAHAGGNQFGQEIGGVVDIPQMVVEGNHLDVEPLHLPAEGKPVGDIPVPSGDIVQDDGVEGVGTGRR